MTNSKNANNKGVMPTDAVAGNPKTRKRARRGNSAAETIKVLKVYASEISDGQRVCTADEAEKYADPLTAMMPELVGRVSRPQLVEFAKTLESNGLDFSKLTTKAHCYDAKCQCQHCQNKAELLDMARRGEPRPW